jgi:hypothetical protein
MPSILSEVNNGLLGRPIRFVDLIDRLGQSKMVFADSRLRSIVHDRRSIRLMDVIFKRPEQNGVRRLLPAVNFACTLVWKARKKIYEATTFIYKKFRRQGGAGKDKDPEKKKGPKGYLNRMWCRYTLSRISLGNPPRTAPLNSSPSPLESPLHSSKTISPISELHSRCSASCSPNRICGSLHALGLLDPPGPYLITARGHLPPW